MNDGFENGHCEQFSLDYVVACFLPEPGVVLCWGMIGTRLSIYNIYSIASIKNFKLIKEAIMAKHPEHEEKHTDEEHPEHEEKGVVSDRKKSSVTKAADDSITPPKSALVRLRLRLIANYAMRGFAPAVAVLALIIAVIAVTGNQSGQAQLSKANAVIDSLGARLSASKGELEKLKADMAQGKAMQEERVTKIIQSTNQLQVIMHISPTLEEELYQLTRASAVPPSFASAVAAPEKLNKK